MNESDRRVARRIRAAMPDDPGEPDFAATWQAASCRAGRRRYRLHLAAAAAVAAIAVIVVANLSGPPDEALEYIEMSELMGSTSWTAPSDVLLPESRFDIYQDLPTLIESTEVDGGTLL